MLDKKIRKKANQDFGGAIEEICASTWESVYRYIYFKVQNRQEAEDITQETYVKTLTFLRSNQLRGDGMLGFLKSVALNVLRDRWRKSKRMGASVSIEKLNPMETAVDDVMEQSTLRALLEEALNHLDPVQRRVVELRILKGYSANETAKIMGKKAGTIRVIQYRALQKLAAILNKNNALEEV